ncbi:MAG TPA: choice-of-anchor tandem repeat NxxGxxAF-containing protein [Planctomycetota bacterium]|nr:choice-of-anchor tandem repeat NxxGxxAF-containing protein [Planctomycetota bacterium]
MQRAIVSRVSAALFLLPTATAASIVAQSAPPALQKIALSGEAAPGTGPGARFTSFSGPRLDLAGRAAFYANLAGTGVSSANDQGIFSATSGALSLVVREGSAAPGTAGAAFTAFDLGAVNVAALGVDAAGHVSFLGQLVGGDVCDCNHDGVLDNHTGWWSTKSGALTKLARANDPVPAAPSGTLFDTVVGAPIVSANGALAQLFVFKGSGVDFFNSEGILSDAAGSLGLVVRSGDPAPGFAPGVTFEFFGRPFVGPNGDISFFANLAGPGMTELNDDTIWALRSGELTLIVREGDPAPGGDVIGNPSVTGAFHNVSQRGGDKLAFSSLLAAGGSAIFSDASGSLVSVVRSGMQAPGLPAGVQFQSFGAYTTDGPIQLADDGRLAFAARLNTPNPSNESLWLADPDGELKLIARGGDAPPGAPAGMTFTTNTFGIVPTFGSMAMNASGQVAFDAFLAGPGLPDFQRKGLYATDPKGTLVKILQPGDLVDVHGDGTEMRTVLTVAFNKDGASLEQYNGVTFSDQARLVFRVTFTDGSSGVFASDVGPWTDLGGTLAGALGAPLLTASGTLAGGALDTVRLSRAAPEALVGLFASVSSTPIPFFGGIVFPIPPDLSLVQATDAKGEAAFSFVAPAVLPPGSPLFFQYVVLDATAPAGIAFSNGLRGEIP